MPPRSASVLLEYPPHSRMNACKRVRERSIFLAGGQSLARSYYEIHRKEWSIGTPLLSNSPERESAAPTNEQWVKVLEGKEYWNWNEKWEGDGSLQSWWARAVACTPLDFQDSPSFLPVLRNQRRLSSSISKDKTVNETNVDGWWRDEVKSLSSCRYEWDSVDNIDRCG